MRGVDSLGGSGFLLGKFLPPHRGHQYLINFAKNYVDNLTVLIATLEREPIPGLVRYQWMQELFPNVRIVHCDEELPQYPAESTAFWDIWRDVCQRYLPTPPDFVFASEPYGPRLAKELGGEYVPVDHNRELAPISGERIRTDPLGAWEFIPEPVRPWFVKRVCLFGPESTGKSELATDLAQHYGTVHVHEYARPMITLQGDRFDESDMPRIARGQWAAEEAMARHANRVLFVDTDLLTTSIWSQFLYGRCPEWIEKEGAARHYDLTLLLDIDAPWVDDNQRFLADQRQEFFDQCKEALERNNRRYQVISGSWEHRLSTAINAVDTMMAERPVNPYKA
jgi:NadR type nicotinamide-nucleotide adenylyltransferase